MYECNTVIKKIRKILKLIKSKPIVNKIFKLIITSGGGEEQYIIRMEHTENSWGNAKVQFIVQVWNNNNLKNKCEHLHSTYYVLRKKLWAIYDSLIPDEGNVTQTDSLVCPAAHG